MFFARITSLFLLLCLLMITLSSCTISKPFASETDVTLTTEGNNRPNASVTEPSFPEVYSNDSGTNAENTIIAPPPTSTEAVPEAAGYISYKEEIVALHNDRVKNSQWFNDIDITDIVTRQVRKGNLSENGEATVILFEVKLSGALWPHYPVYIIEDAEGRIIWYWGDFFEAAPYTSCFYLNDIDGDGYCEIISQHDSGGNGGFGGYYSYIFKVVNRSLEQLFPSEIQDWFIFDTGFTLSLYDGFHFTINNKFVPFEMTFTRERYDTPYFDNYGSVTCTIDRSEDEMMVDSFYIFTPVDFDNDGVYEIMTAQYCSLWGHSDGIGTAYTILKYDNISGEMRVIKAGFWEYLDDSFNETDYDAHNNEQWLLYEQNWYKKME